MNTSTPTSAPKRLMLDEKDFFDVLRAQRPSLSIGIQTGPPIGAQK